MSDFDALPERGRFDRLSHLRWRDKQWHRFPLRRYGPSWPYRICRSRQRVVLIRHAEPSPGRTDPDLSAQGRSRAAELVHVMGDTGLTKIIVSHLKRTKQTAADLAAHSGLTPVVIDAGDTEAIVAEINSAPGRVLVVGHSNTVPDIVERLGGGAMTDLEHDEFDNLFVVQHGVVMRLRYAVPPTS